ncbi:LysR family transcriptional regulator [Radicibacter daui]|uniref:LysR family transcriptional regulator n=1 Tax=Radicibacter daui TaxID=3064829 RepID=UPI004046CF92
MSRLNLEQLRTFLAIVRLGGVRRAADTLNVTQPAVTSRLKNLEDTLGAELFERSTTGVRLTKRGELLVRYAERFEELAALVEKDVMDPEAVEGTLRIGVSETIAQCWLPELIAELHKAYPALVVEVNVDISVNLRAGLMGREIDLAVLLGPISDYSVNNVELPGFDLAWYRAVNAPEPEEGPAGYLRGPVVTYARNTRPYRELKAALFERYGAGVSIFPSSSLSACFRLVEVGLGVAALPRALGRQFVESGRLCEFDPGWLPAPLRFSASWLGEPQSHVAETAAKIARDVAERFAAERPSGDKNS